MVKEGFYYPEKGLLVWSNEASTTLQRTFNMVKQGFYYLQKGPLIWSNKDSTTLKKDF